MEVAQRKAIKLSLTNYVNIIFKIAEIYPHLGICVNTQMWGCNFTKKKSKKLALIAVCNTLLKQAFAIAKSGLIYDETYRSILVNN